MLKKFILFIFSISIITGFSQVKHGLMQLRNVTSLGHTDTMDVAPIVFNPGDSTIIITGNQKINGQQYNGLVASQADLAANSWVNSFSNGSNKMFVTAAKTDSQGNIYTCGTIRTGTGLDYFLCKTDETGAIQFIVPLDGPNSTNDVALALCLDEDNSRLFVTGGSDGTFLSLQDYCTECYDMSTGASLWASPARYNFSNSFDVATHIAYDKATDHVIVSGFSGVTFTDYDIATVTYKASDGSQYDVQRESNSIGAGEDRVFGMATDTLGNVYIGGSTFQNNHFIGVVHKRDTALNAIWTKTIDLHGFDNHVMSLVLDDSLNVLVAGLSHLNTNEHHAFVFKYTNNGNPVWSAPLIKNPGTSEEALILKLKSGDEIFVGGHVKESNGNQDILFTRLNRQGQPNMGQRYSSSGSAVDRLMDFTLNQTDTRLYASVRSYNGVDYDNKALEYHYREVEMKPKTDTVINEKYADKEVLVEFHKSTLRMNAINNRDKLYGTLGEFVQDSTCAKIEDLLDPVNELRLKAKDLKVRKIHPQLTEADSVSQSRLGTSVKVYPFYQTLLIELPDTFNTPTVWYQLNALQPDVLKAGLNRLAEIDWTPNDSLYNQQGNLHAIQWYGNAHINCEKAWDYTKGHSFVKVGVYDTGVTPHSDILNIVFNDSYISGTTINDFDNHGTCVAGIIGAKSNNVKGVAGIAGGDANASGALNTGASIYNIKLFEGNQSATLANFRNALVQGAVSGHMSNSSGLDVMNNSWGMRNVAYDSLLMDAVNQITAQGAAFVASRGNHGQNPWNNVVKPNAHNLPATLRPRSVMCVGASGTDGHFHRVNVNGQDRTSAFSKGVDFVAPGAKDVILTTSAYGGGNIPFKGASASGVNAYLQFGLTSAAAPHVAGIAALMISYRSNGINWFNLPHDDIEALIKRSATDLVSPGYPYFETLGVDSMTGHGRVNADSALACLQPQYNLRHIDRFHCSSFNITSTTVNSGTWIWRGEGGNSIPAGTYDMEQVEIKHDYNYAPLYGTEQLIDSWPLHMVSNLLGPMAPGSVTLPHQDKHYVNLVSASNSAAQTKGYAYHLTTWHLPGGGTQAVNLWIPDQSTQLNTGLTLYTKAGVEVSLKDELEPSVDYFNLYPNPNTGDFTLGYSSRKESSGVVSVLDISGRKVWQEDKEVKNGLNRYHLNLKHLPRGIYLVTLEVEENRGLTKKLIIE